ncbi:DUF368 domain-containing protein [bacterium]|nr:DUF368 domain-containing protein [bacterium]
MAEEHLDDKLRELPEDDVSHLAANPVEPTKAGLIRTLVGGGLMGVANIIPGVSGGTMVLAMGLYEEFVESVADVTRLRWRMRPFVFLAVLGFAAIVAIGASVVPISWGLHNIHHIMYALFIGLTLGGVPLIWKEITPLKPGAIGGTIAGFLAMVGIAFFLNDMPLPVNWLTFLIAGFIASAAMVLPGISGSYLLLIFGLYLPFTDRIKEFLHAVKEVDFGLAFSIGLHDILPIGVGVILGIAGLTNVLKALLHRCHDATMGVLLGLLVGSVVGLWPFQKLVEDGETVVEAHPATPLNILLVLGALGVGFVITFIISRLGEE